MIESIKWVLRRVPWLFRALRAAYRFIIPARDPQRWLQGRIERALADRPDAFFIQVGSNDGSQGDPLRELIRRHSAWRGIFIEPVGFVFERLRRNYAGSGRFAFERSAIGAERGRAPFYYVSEAAKEHFGDELPYWYDQLGSFDRGHVLKHLDGKLEPFIVEEEVECLTFADLIERHGVRRVDLLHIDAEGADFTILSRFPFASMMPRVVLFEHKHLRPEQRTQAAELLASHGFRLTEVYGDTLAVREAGAAPAAIGR